MLLSQYQRLTRRLLSDPTFARINDFDLRDYINIARSQVAIDGECVRVLGTANVTAGIFTLPIAQLTVPADAGLSQALVVRNAYLSNVRVNIRSWDWFYAYNAFNPTSIPVAAHQGQGTFATFFISSVSGGTLDADVVALPVDLVDDSTVDAVPYPWIDAVSFYAAWYASIAAEREDQADKFMTRYRDLMRRARSGVTSTNLPENDPGGMGAMIANSKMSLGALQPAPPARGRGVA